MLLSTKKKHNKGIKKNGGDSNLEKVASEVMFERALSKMKE